MELFDEFIWPFHAFVATHIVTGSVGLVAFWVAVIARKGHDNHRQWGTYFFWSMLLTGSVAMVMASLTIADPIKTHPHLELPAVTIQGIFGWMMLYLALLTVNLAWYGRECIRNRRCHEQHRTPFNLFLQFALAVAAVNCGWRGWQINQPLMTLISFVGIATVVTNLLFMTARSPSMLSWQREHLKGLVGAGISVYTAFFAFGAVRIAPEWALNPVLWSMPLSVGLAIILYHWWRIRQREMLSLRAR